MGPKGAAPRFRGDNIMKLLLPFIAGISLLIPQVASAYPKDKDKKVPPGQAKKAASAQTQVQRTSTATHPSAARSTASHSPAARPTATREYVAPTPATP